MSRPSNILLAFALVAAGPAILGAQHDHAGGGSTGDDPPQLLDNLGTLAYPVTTTSMAQLWFNQGLRFYWAFNHEEAIRSFREAERLDPNCAMCAFGQALSLGPNINAPMEDAAAKQAWEIVQRAERLPGKNGRESGMIAALRQRYDPSLSRAAADSAWATAIGKMAAAHPGDLELKSLAAEAIMDLSPWNYWSNGEPRPQTADLLAMIDAVIAVNPNHPGACHLLIHAVEAVDPERALGCAERLASLMPGAGHLVHMPAHIYIRLGRYDDAIKLNEHAVHADQHLFEGPGKANGFYGLSYYPHNWHFMSFAAAMDNNRGVALKAARETARSITPTVARAVPAVEPVGAITWYTMVTFGEWAAILAEPMPPADLRFTSGMAYYARGMALSAGRRWPEARAALDSVQRIAKAYPEGEPQVALQIAALALEGEMQLRSGNPKQSVVSFTKATALEDGLNYTEPPTWYYPIRQSLGKAQLAAGDAAGAEATYRHDLKQFPGNGWSLIGLHQSLVKQGRMEEAATLWPEVETTWKGQVRPGASRF
ncbi:MAG TPA: tetratricopeptide repeat protein [Gemmatimonadales bacterium]|nr:tetratricopeptide repeat protein [Gemmatimonadales bacterium]